MSIKLTNDKMIKSLQRMQKELDSVPKQLYDYWVSITPKKTGNARRRTRLQKDTISAQYPYAVPLDEGHSKQAPDGMSKPAEKELEKLLNRVIRK